MPGIEFNDALLSIEIEPDQHVHLLTIHHCTVKVVQLASVLKAG